MTAKTSFRGSFTALFTPFKNGSLDEKAFRDIVEWQIAEGTNGLVPVGTTGESPTLSHDEHKQVVEWCINQADGRVPVIAGSGSNSTAEAIELSRHAEYAGAPVRAEKRCRREARDRQHGARFSAAPGHGLRLQSAVGRRHHSARLHG